MAKFRSWNEVLKEFCYFENGEYSYSIKDYESKSCLNFDKFNWQNAEQEIKVDSYKCFVGDIGVLRFLERNPNSMMGKGCNRVKTLKGVVGFDYRGLYIDDGKNCYYIIDYRTRAQFEIIGNIHEELTCK